MKHLVLTTLLLLSFSSLAYAQSKTADRQDPKVEQELRTLVRIWDQATVKGDTAALDRLLADEWSFVGGPNKAEYLASFKNTSPDSQVESAISSDIEVQLYENFALLTWMDTIKGTNQGKAFVTRWLYMDVWVKRDGRWQCVKTYSNQVSKSA